MDNRTSPRRRIFKAKFEECLLGTSKSTVVDTSEDEKEYQMSRLQPTRRRAVLKQKPYKIPKRTLEWNNEYFERFSNKNRIIRQQQKSQSLLAIREQEEINETNDISQFLKKFPQLCGTQNEENTNVTENVMKDSPEYDIGEKVNEVDNSLKSTKLATAGNETEIETGKNDNTQNISTEISNSESVNDTVIVTETNDLVKSENSQGEIANKLKSVNFAAVQNEILEDLVENGYIFEHFVTIGNFSLCRNDLQTLMANNWINDQIINAYMFLIEERSKQQSNLPQIFALDTYVYQQLDYDKFEDALKWTQNINMYDNEMMIFPLCLKKSHWCLIVIDLKCSRIEYYDSLKNCSEKIFMTMNKYLHELQRQAGKDIQDFKTSVVYVPKQNNFDDCGAFTCMFAEQVSKRLPISYAQEDMSEYRFKILKSLIAKKILDEEELVDDTK